MMYGYVGYRFDLMQTTLGKTSGKSLRAIQELKQNRKNMYQELKLRIQELKIELLSAKAILHCKGLLEQMLKEVYFEKK